MSGQSKPSSASRTEKPETGELREKLKHADMSLFDRFMKRIVQAPKTPAKPEK